MSKLYLVTGGAGFIGSHLTERLAAHNQVVILDTLRRNALAPAGLDKHPNVKVSSDGRPMPAVAASSMNSSAPSLWYRAIISFEKLPMTRLGRPDPS